jgi:glutathione-specific gamma-glutamylcyclotransferase
MWIFAYGSILFRPGFAYLERRRAYVPDVSRRLWQGSPDHRGTEEAPGLVATLVSCPGAWCGGAIYRLSTEQSVEILASLDHRERAGFRRVTVDAHDRPSGSEKTVAITYVADPSNDHFLGPLEEDALAELVRQRRGPSGTNVDYVLRLRDALRELDIDDPHVETVAGWLAQTVSCS